MHGGSWKANETNSTMVDKVYKDIVCRCALQDFAVSGSCQDLNKVLWCDISTLVINLAPFVNIFARHTVISGLVEELAWKRIPVIVCNVINCHENDVGFGNAFRSHDLVRMASVCLVAVVTIARRTSNNDCPV